MSIESVMASNHLNLCLPLLLLPSISPSIRVFSNESLLPIRWPKDWSFSSSISPSNEYSGLISFRMDWFDILDVQGSLKSLLQHHSSKAMYTFDHLDCHYVFVLLLGYHRLFFSTQATSWRPDFKREIHSSFQGSPNSMTWLLVMNSSALPSSFPWALALQQHFKPTPAIGFCTICSLCCNSLLSDLHMAGSFSSSSIQPSLTVDISSCLTTLHSITSW